MGCGATHGARLYSKQIDAATDAERQLELQRGRCTELETELRWLRDMFAKEKVEKEWLMKRFDAVEKELAARNEELATIQQRPSSLPLPSQQQPPPRAEPPALQPLQTRATNLAPATVDSPKAGGKLSERRGLKLGGVVTGKSEAGPPKISVLAPKEESQPTGTSSEPLPRQSQRTKDFLQSLESNTDGPVEPMTDSRVGARAWRGADAVPMSPLLARRTNWSLPASNTSSGSDNLSVEATKLQRLDEPCTPKRAAPKRNRAMFTKLPEEAEDNLSPNSRARRLDASKFQSGPAGFCPSISEEPESPASPSTALVGR
eukprot:gnl/TRDRNA2_/TRDRNA2_198445_c0_seq1.p1 gnl/TRDRNA2_/TRDRNA2_198445_c0~~gnl/TRDRNA2_/TRDRNA2_198445_c0_seq1.p1  ORF type:complete len:317 (-),score=67.03 gnl/TRDRNA2_/TRDRNA2_198445_c0_seq1:69-1019(-)